MIKPTSILLGIVSLLWVSLFMFLYTLSRVEQIVLPAWSTPLLTHYKPKNGDILMVHYVGHGLHGIPLAEAWPTHTAFVYVNSHKEAFALEATRFAAPEQPNFFFDCQQKLSGIRMVPLAHYINAIDSVLYIREIENEISYEKVEAEFDWIKSLEFETRILDSMTLDVTIAIGFRLVWPQISKACAIIAKLQEVKRRDKQVFCSEFVSRLLQRLHAVRKDFADHFLMSPASFLKSCPVQPNLEFISDKTFSWKNDRMLVRSKSYSAYK
jgi:hypothetical protein